MRTSLLHFGSAILAAVGLVVIAVSLLSLSPNLFADEPIAPACTYPSPCDGKSAGQICSDGDCSPGYVCNPCCSCNRDDTGDGEYSCGLELGC